MHAGRSWSCRTKQLDSMHRQRSVHGTRVSAADYFKSLGIVRGCSGHGNATPPHRQLYDYDDVDLVHRCKNHFLRFHCVTF